MGDLNGIQVASRLDVKLSFDSPWIAYRIPVKLAHPLPQCGTDLMLGDTCFDLLLFPFHESLDHLREHQRGL